MNDVQSVVAHLFAYTGGVSLTGMWDQQFYLAGYHSLVYHFIGRDERPYKIQMFLLHPGNRITDYTTGTSFHIFCVVNYELFCYDTKNGKPKMCYCRENNINNILAYSS